MAVLSQNIEAISNFLLPDLLPQATLNPNDPLLNKIKITTVNADKVQYDQWQNSWGITSYRGLGGDPPVIQFPTFQRQEMDPGYWGEKGYINEAQLTKGRKPGTLADPAVVSDVTSMATLHLFSRLVSQIRYALSQVIQNGLYQLVGLTGQKFAYQIQGYSSQQLAPGTPWVSSASSATPINDLLNFKATLQKASSNKFGKTSVLLANSISLANLFATNQIISSYKGPYGSNILGLDGEQMASGLNTVTQGFELPTIVVYDHGYYNNQAAAAAKDKTQFTYIIPTNTFLWLGERENGGLIGEWQMTRHAGLLEEVTNYPNADAVLEKWEGPKAVEAGVYVRAHYQNKQPHQYELEIGANGSPLLGYPDAVAVITTT